MPDVQEVFRLATQKVRPDPGALERQQDQQRRHTTRRKAGAYALAAALVAAIAVIGGASGGRLLGAQGRGDPAAPLDARSSRPGNRSAPSRPTGRRVRSR